MHDLLTDPVITLETDEGRVGASLPETLALLLDDQVRTFPALRPHQAPALHAFLVQLAHLATEDRAVPTDAAGWAAALRALTPEWPEDEPWRLVAPAAAPGFLQPAAPGGDLSPYTTVIATPDELDPLVTAKNHDLKAARMRAATAEDWLFALVNLQTAEGYGGKTKYGVMRMNGGYGSRPFLSALPAGAGLGARFRRDLEVLRRNRNAIFARAPAFANEREAKLLWLEPWDGTQSLLPGELHPLAIEICRRIRLEPRSDGSGLRARGTGTTAPRVAAKDLRGVTGDPWAPVETDKEGAKVLSITGAGFGWALMRDLLTGGGERHFETPLLARPVAEDGAAVEIMAAALARGEGKTEGFHTRRVAVKGRAAVRALAEEGEEQRRLAELARTFSSQAKTAAGRCLRPALFVLFEKGREREERKRDRKQEERTATVAQVGPWMQRFDRMVDRAFFGMLWPGVADEAARTAAERAWVGHLHESAREVFEQAAEAAPSTDQRRILAEQRARDLLHFALRKHLPLPDASTATPETQHAG